MFENTMVKEQNISFGKGSLCENFIDYIWNMLDFLNLREFMHTINEKIIGEINLMRN